MRGDAGTNGPTLPFVLHCYLQRRGRPVAGFHMLCSIIRLLFYIFRVPLWEHFIRHDMHVSIYVRLGF